MSATRAARLLALTSGAMASAAASVTATPMASPSPATPMASPSPATPSAPPSPATPSAKPRVDLRLRAPTPRHLAMRPAHAKRVTTAASGGGAGAGRENEPSLEPRHEDGDAGAPNGAAAGAGNRPAGAGAGPGNGPERGADNEAAVALSSPADGLAFHFDLGFALEGAATSNAPTLSGQQIGGQFAEIRSYGFGDVFLGSRGLILPNVTAFLSAYYRVASDLGKPSPVAETTTANDLQIRSGWAEIKDPSDLRWLSPLRLRAGRYYIYGPWVMHVDGVTAAWDGKVVSAAFTLGGRVSELTAGGRGGLPMPLTQLSVRSDFTARKHPLPVIASAEVLAMPEHVNAHGQLAWQPRPHLAVAAAVRALDGELVHERLSIRGRFHEINSVYAELAHRHRDDWRWDPGVVQRDDLVSSSPRPYLELGPVLPRLSAQLRTGTVLFDNVDLLARAATAIDLTREDDVKSSFSAGYLELGGALEVRLRRTLAVGAALSTRATRRQPITPVLDELGPAPLPPDGSYGERSFVEAGTTARLSLGARTLTFAGELYARRTRFAELYTVASSDPAAQILGRETHAGGRVSVDAWVGRRLRVMARYELVSKLRLAPEITGFKALRVLVEATF